MKIFEPHEGRVALKHSFSEAWYFLSCRGEVNLETDRGAIFKARASITSRGPHRGEKTIRFFKDKQEYARSYSRCWGHYYNCYGTRMGMYCKALDNYISNSNNILERPQKFSSTIKKTEILQLSEKYDRDHPWWIKKEKSLGDRIRSNGEFGFHELKEIVEWKFKGLPGRLKYVMRLVSKNEDLFIRNISKSVLSLSFNHDAEKLVGLRRIHGVGISIASVILTFYDPQNYCVLDIHVWRELYGKEPKSLFISNKHYLKLLSDLRKLSKDLHLTVRTIEKALFKRNYDRKKY